LTSKRILRGDTMKLLKVVWLAVLLAVSDGCSGTDDQGPKRVAATGTVNYKGQPVEGASVVMTPDSGTSAAMGKTDASGQFKLGTKEAGDGAVPGKYKVMISKTETTTEEIPETDPRYGTVTPKTTVKEHLPAKYKDPKKSGLTVEIKDGEDNVLPPFELSD
jgi:hypothetical protein